MGRKRILGEVSDFVPVYKDIKLIYVTTEQYRLVEDGVLTKEHIVNPSFWFDFNGVLYYAICAHEMEFLEGFEDWEIGEKGYFNNYKPDEDEFECLMKLVPVIYKVDFDTLDEFHGETSQYEMDFIEPYIRDRKINDILK